ncbi:hypothetical protein BFINE_36270 [Bacteroides finegoldii DSM 17565]|nr:hypothetical protein BFINE_36270 [Bacteroides finegoldii DSM 17565]
MAPLFVTRIEDSEGNVISTFAPQMDEVISTSSVYKMLVMLRAVINEGTGGRVRRYGITADMGGKTGRQMRTRIVGLWLYPFVGVRLLGWR